MTFIFFRPSRFIYALLIALFLLTRSAEQWHSIEHALAADGDNDVCVICAHADSYSFTPSINFTPLVLWLAIGLATFSFFSFSAFPLTHYNTRAPPLMRSSPTSDNFLPMH